jgi:hypothetical protein
MISKWVLLACSLLCFGIGCEAFVVSTRLPAGLQVPPTFEGRVPSHKGRLPVPSSPEHTTYLAMNKDSSPDDMNPLTKASWYAVEVFGKAFASDKKESSPSLEEPPKSLQETIERIQLDNDRSYFLSGEVDRLIYDEQCVFADPFVSFAGRDRFVENLANLGSFITKYSAKMLDYQVSTDETVVNSRVMVKLELNLPWKPVLAWPWGVRYEIDPETNLITTHRESWDIEPLEVRNESCCGSCVSGHGNSLMFSLLLVGWLVEQGVKQIFRKATTQVKN